MVLGSVLGTLLALLLFLLLLYACVRAGKRRHWRRMRRKTQEGTVKEGATPTTLAPAKTPGQQGSSGKVQTSQGGKGPSYDNSAFDGSSTGSSGSSESETSTVYENDSLPASGFNGQRVDYVNTLDDLSTSSASEHQYQNTLPTVQPSTIEQRVAAVPQQTMNALPSFQWGVRGVPTNHSRPTTLASITNNNREMRAVRTTLRPVSNDMQEHIQAQPSGSDAGRSMASDAGLTQQRSDAHVTPVPLAGLTQQRINAHVTPVPLASVAAPSQPLRKPPVPPVRKSTLNTQKHATQGFYV